MGQATDKSGAVELKKEITLFQAVSICVGYMIGSGIFVSPYGVLTQVRSVGLSLVIWALCGLFNMLGALCYAELGTTFMRSGGEYTYIMEGFGRLPAFICLWTTFILVLSVMTTASALIFATYILTPVYPTCDPDIEAVKAIAVITILLLMMMNCLNVNWAARVQVLFACSAVVALVAVVAIGFYAIARGYTDHFTDTFEGSDYSADAIAVSFYSGFWAYSGWNSLNSIAGEIKNPRRNLPLAIVISISLVTGIYLMTNVAYLAILSVPEMLSTTAVAVTFANKTLGGVAWTMPVFVALSIIGTVNGGLMAVSRVFFIGAQDGNFPKILGMINYRFLTPAPAILSTSLLAISLVPSTDIFYLIELVGFSLAVILMTTYAAMVYMRIKYPDLSRPVKLPLVMPIVLLLLYAALLGLTVYRKPIDCLIAAGVMAAGVPLYLFGVVWKYKPKTLQNAIDGCTKFLQKLFLVVPQDTPLNTEHDEQLSEALTEEKTLAE